jgi:hypothetical protein
MNRLSLLLFVLFTAVTAKAQQQKISQNLLIQLNKNNCTAGDSLRFKCYVINSVDHVQEDNNLYIVLTGENGKFISRHKYPIFSSGALGTIPIPKGLSPGVCYIEAFTPYMINHNIVKVNQVIINSTPGTPVAAEVLCKIYYDNNRLVSRMPNTFYIKTLYPGNVPVSCEVLLKDSDDKQQGKYFTDINGIAKITFAPQKNQVYSLQINNQEKTYKFPLLTADSSGISMQLSFDSNIVYYQVNKNYPVHKSQDLFTIIASQKNEVVYSSEISFENYNNTSGGINIKGLHTGVLKLSLLNKEGVTVAASSVYLQNNRDFEEVSLNKITDAGADKSRFDVSLAGKAMKFFSIAVEDAGAHVAEETGDLDFFYSNKLNTPGLDSVVDFWEFNAATKKGTTANYKILNPNNKLFLSQAPLLKLNDEYATTIKGKVYNGNTEKLLSGGTLKISYEEMDKPLDYSVHVNSDGSFLLDSLVFSGKNKFYYNYFDRSNKEISCRVQLMENENSKILDSLMVLQFGYKPAVKINAEVNNEANTKSLPEVKTATPGKDKKQNVNDLYTTGIYSGQSSSFIDNINSSAGDGSIPGTEFIKNRIQNVAVQNGNLVNTKTFSMQQSQFWVIGIMIDESPASFSDLAILTSKDIALVKFFDVGHASTGMNNPGGLVAVYTKNSRANKPGGKTENLTSGQFFEYEGFSNYLNTAITTENNAGKNELIYWNPSVILNKDQNNFSFETVKLKQGAAYKIKLRGYNQLGQLINFEKLLKN